MTQTNCQRVGILCLLVGVIFSLPVESARAIDIGVSPTSFTVNINPGQSYENTLFLTNKSRDAVTLKILTRAFKPSDDTAHEGEVQFSEKLPLPNEAHYKLTASPSSFTLDRNETRDVSFKITTGAKAPPAGYYVGIVVQTQPDRTDVQAKVAQFVSTEITIPILTQLGGKLKESAEIVKFEAEKPSYDRGPVTLKLEMRNDGNVHFAPIGRVDILTPEGDRLDTIQFKGKNILPGDTRTTDVVWNKVRLPLGKKVAKVILLYGQETIEQETSFEVLPSGFTSSAGTTIGVLVALVLVFGLFGRRRKKRKGPRRR